MFSRVSAVLSRNSVRRAGVWALPLIAVGLVVPFAAAGGPDHGHNRRHDRGGRDTRFGIVIRPEIVIGRRPEVVVIERRPAPRVEVAPMSLRFTAYQSEDRVIVDIKGVNPGEGFTTTVSAGNRWQAGPEINLCNLAPAESCGRGEASFNITASLRAHSAVSCITVRVAGQTYTVPVTQATPLS